MIPISPKVSQLAVLVLDSEYCQCAWIDMHMIARRRNDMTLPLACNCCSPPTASRFCAVQKLLNHLVCFSVSLFFSYLRFPCFRAQLVSSFSHLCVSSHPIVHPRSDSDRRPKYSLDEMADAVGKWAPGASCTWCSPLSFHSLNYICCIADGPVLSQTDLYLLNVDLELHPILADTSDSFQFMFNLATGATNLL